MGRRRVIFGVGCADGGVEEGVRFWRKRKARKDESALQDLTALAQFAETNLKDSIARWQAEGRSPQEIMMRLDDLQADSTEQGAALREHFRFSSPRFDEAFVRLHFLNEWRGLVAAERRKLWDMVSGTLEQARECEQEGDLDKALPLYEALIYDGFQGTLPYDRLRIIYTRQKRFEDAIRVCEAYVALKDRAHGQDKAHFQHHQDKLQTRLERSQEKG